MRSRPNSPGIQLQVFGVPMTFVRGCETRLSLKRAVALLAYLGLNAAPLPREHLAAMLWPDADEPRARTRLRRLTYTIESALGDKVLSSDNDCLALNADHVVEIDLLQFAHFARRAVATATFDEDTLKEAHQWVVRARHPLMQGVAFGSDIFDDWLKAVSLDHEHLLARLLERLVDALASQGDFASAMELAEVLVSLDPYREPSYVQLMQLHALQGHSAGVEAAYTRCAEVLRAEFGIRPGPQTESAYLRMTEDLKRLSSNRVEPPSVRFAESGLGAVAYTIIGKGERTLVISPGFVFHLEIALEYAPFRACIEALANGFRVILFDRRGVGLSERLGATSTPAALASDIAAIHLVHQRSCNHGHHDPGGLSAAPTYERRHAHAQAVALDPGSLRSRRPQAGRLAQARARHRHGRGPAQSPAAPGGHRHLPRHAQRVADRAEGLLRLHLGRGELMARMQPVKLPRTLPVLLSVPEAVSLIAAARNIKHQARIVVQ